MDALKKVTFAISIVLNAVKRKLPFTRVVLISDPNNWIEVDYFSVLRSFFFSRVVAEKVKFSIKESYVPIDIDKNFRTKKYKGISLYCVSVYNICVALEVFPSKISFGTAKHRETISEWFSKSTECIDFFEKQILAKKPRKVLISQGYNFDSAVVRALSCAYDFDVVAVENTFNKNKIVWDDVSGITVNKNLAKNYFWKFIDTVEESVAASYVSEYLTGIKQVKSTEHQTPLTLPPTSDKQTILFVGQVYSDSSVLFGINDFACPEDIIESLVDYCVGNDYRLILKLHPKEVSGNNILCQPYNDLTYRKLAQRSGLLEKIMDNDFILDKGTYDTYALIDVADVCVTINSQAGLEALIKGKDLVVCGQSFYSGLGFTFDALNRDGLICSLNQVLVHDVSVLNNTEVNKFFYITSEKYFMERTEKSIRQLLVS